MELYNSTAEIFIPDGQPETEALRRITHLGIGAHQDDLEFMAFHGILECFGHNDKWFGGVTCTNGSGSSRTGPYARLTDEQMMRIRRQEQNAAATIGQYSVMIQLDHPSQTIKCWDDRHLKNDLFRILNATHPEVVYTHNPADKHDTHIAVVVAAIQAMREMLPSKLPKRVIGCEVWRNLDWLPDEEKIVMDVSGHDSLAAALNRVFDSQIAGGKRYDLATYGRRAANATFFDSHATDKANQVIFGIDLTPLAKFDPNIDVRDYVCGFIDRFRADVRKKFGDRFGYL
jgi:LmbE family N-acetylglucosaminyl deacetylase